MAHQASTTPASSNARAAGVVFASLVGNALGVTPTVIAVFGIFLPAIASEFHWLRTEVGGALALVLIITALAQPISGWLCDSFGTRRTVLLGSVALGLAVASLWFTTASPLLFYIQFAVIGAAGAIASNLVYAKLISDWFENRRGLWIGVAGGVGNGLGATLLPIAAGLLLPIAGWRGSFLVIGGLILLIGVPLQLLLIREPPVRTSGGAVSEATAEDFEGVSMATALRSPAFWLLATSLPVGAGCLISVFSMIAPMLTDRGFSVDAATLVMAACAATATLWEPTVGFILDHTKRPRILAPLYLIAAGGVALLLFGATLSILFLAGVLIALGLGAEASALAFLLSRYFGRRHLGTISGLAFGILLGTNALATVSLSAAYDATHSYRVIIFAIVPVLVWNGAALLFLQPYPFTAGGDPPADGHDGRGATRISKLRLGLSRLGPRLWPGQTPSWVSQDESDRQSGFTNAQSKPVE